MNKSLFEIQKVLDGQLKDGRLDGGVILKLCYGLLTAIKKAIGILIRFVVKSNCTNDSLHEPK